MIEITLQVGYNDVIDRRSVMAVSDKILRLRREKGLSQEAFAEMLGVSRQSVSRWESGTVVPDIDKILLMSEIFGVTTDFLLKSDPENTPIEESSDSTESEASDSGIPLPAEEYESTDSGDSATEGNGNNSDNDGNGEEKKFSPKALIAWILVFCIMIATLCIPLYWGEIKKLWWNLNGGRVDYPYVLVHGLGGWGESAGINNISPYWGSTSGDLAAQLRAEGFEVHTPTVGPVSSAWDRACELYAQLTGTQVDYGEAHSKAHNHERFGRTYTEPLIQDWGQELNGGQLRKINLIGHSFGGATVRLLTSLLEYGDEAEKNASGENVSPLFEGGKGEWVFSVTTLCAPHNGSSLTEIINNSDSLLASIGALKSGNSLVDSVLSSIGLTDILSRPDIFNTTDLLISFCLLANNLTEPINGAFDLMLDQFGINSLSDTSMRNSIEKIIASGNDHAAYDLSPDGAAKLNGTIQTVESVYYFSYTYSATDKNIFIGGEAPTLGMLFALQLPALGMGTYTGTTAGGIVIDEKWQENDGLVSVISSQKPDDEEGIYLKGDVTETDAKDIDTGIWNISATKSGHHGTVIGLAPFDADSKQKTKTFYIDLFNFIDSLKR